MATLEKLTRLSEPSIQGAQRAKEALKKARQALEQSCEDYKQIYDMHPKLAFLIADNQTQIKASEIEHTVKEQKQKAEEFEREMAMVIELLKSREVAEKELHSQYLASASVSGGNRPAKKHTLYDHIDQEAVSSVETRTHECISQLAAISKANSELCKRALERMDEIEIPTPEDISVTWTGVRDIGRLVEESQSVVADMEQDLASVDRHCDQLRDTIRDLEADGESVLSIDDYGVLLRDTEEIPGIVTELHGLLDGIQQRADETNVRYLQYTAFFDDNKRQFGIVTKVAAVASEFTFAATESHRQLEDAASEAEGALNDTWGLISWYRGFHSAYDSLIEEMQRRRQIQRQHHAEIEDIRSRLETLYMDEVRARADFVDRAGPFLPSDLCPFIQDPPPYFSVEEAGDVARLASVQSHETRYSKAASAMMVEDSVAPQLLQN
ncbi:hypothetical protein EV179_002995 [Coemansia sp. RSA 487]|nr:hypothetical protein LPJ74_000028 [Coemansia sp. RSA 1843]KAJ2089350.1 hypothetical protein IW138_003518 [Coemansia sp. RSA 986]KAJ2214452.1 hypothetical protein EV179_002995 [Coemansia sp. RSA 487]